MCACAHANVNGYSTLDLESKAMHACADCTHTDTMLLILGNVLRTQPTTPGRGKAQWKGKMVIELVLCLGAHVNVSSRSI